MSADRTSFWSLTLEAGLGSPSRIRLPVMTWLVLKGLRVTRRPVAQAGGGPWAPPTTLLCRMGERRPQGPDTLAGSGVSRSL